MLASELDYVLPENLIAQHPPEQRDGGRLLVVAEGLQDCQLPDLAELVPANALVVLNDTQVMKARVFAHRPETGGRVEILFLDPHPEQPGTWQAMVRANRPLREGQELLVGDNRLVLGERMAQGTRWIHSSADVQALLSEHGHVPLPPYMRRPDTPTDEGRYQTVFAQNWGSAAAPTAGLHLTERMLARMQERGVELGYVTLHVGAGTFKPVSTEHVEEHPMHRERFEITSRLIRQIKEARERGAPVVAVGTTVVRALESASDGRVGVRSTELLITPGYQFAVVDALLTNFHAPRSTLLALVFAFAGVEPIRRAYEHAVAAGYRFLSYGDAMWIPRRCR